MKKTLILTVFLLLSFFNIDAQVNYSIEEAKEIIAAEVSTLEHSEILNTYDLLKLDALNSLSSSIKLHGVTPYSVDVIFENAEYGLKGNESERSDLKKELKTILKL